MTSRRRRGSLTDIDMHALPGAAAPPEIDAFLADAGSRIDAFFETVREPPRTGFFPSDYALVCGVLGKLRRLEGEGKRLCEWGSGFGVVAGMGALLGFHSCGIEIDRRLIAESRSMLEDHHLEVEILEGSFIPEDYEPDPELLDGEGRTFSGRAGAIDEVDVEIDEFDVIFAFPWPGEEEMYFDLFSWFAADGAILITYSALEGVRVQRVGARQALGG